VKRPSTYEEATLSKEWIDKTKDEIDALK